MITLKELRKFGFIVSLNNQNGIVISPASKLTQKQREFIKLNKVALVCELQLEKLYVHWHMITKTEDVCFNVIPPTTIARIKTKFPNAILVEPVEPKNEH